MSVHEPGDEVWVDLHYGPEKATVFTHDDEKGMVAVLVGPLSMGDRYIFAEREVYESKEALEATEAAEDLFG